MKLGYFLSCEEWAPRDLLDQARMAQQAGFDRLWISDHYHPWNDEQGHSGFVWSIIGAIAAAVPGMRVTTAVTCPTMRIHPAVIAQAAATWQGGTQSHRGRHYRVENARIYDLPDSSIPILVSGFGPKSIDLAARVGDGFVTVQADADAVSRFRDGAGADKLVQGGAKVCWGKNEKRARETVHRLWPNEALPGELPQILPTPAHFEQAAQLVTEDMVAEQVPCGPDLDRHLETLEEYEQAGFDELYVNQIGPDQQGFFEAYREGVLPRFETAGSTAA